MPSASSFSASFSTALRRSISLLIREKSGRGMSPGTQSRAPDQVQFPHLEADAVILHARPFLWQRLHETMARRPTVLIWSLSRWRPIVLREDMGRRLVRTRARRRGGWCYGPTTSGARGRWILIPNPSREGHVFVRPKGLGTRTQFGLHACQDRRTLRLATQPEDPNILKSPTAIGCSGHVGQRRMGMYIRPPLWRHPLAVFNLIQLP